MFKYSSSRAPRSMSNFDSPTSRTQNRARNKRESKGSLGSASVASSVFTNR